MEKGYNKINIMRSYGGPSMPERISPRDSLALYFVKAFAILAAVAAHASNIDQTTALSEFFTRSWDMISCISVGNFFLVGGVLYQRTPGDTASFWKKKAVNMILPWVFCAALTCTLRGLLGYPSDLAGYVRWILGVGTWYYYITVYIFFLAFFKPIFNCVPALWACVAVTVVSLVLRTLGMEIPVDRWVQSEYLNPMYWMGFFALGVLLRKKGLRLNKWVTFACFAIFVVSAVVVYRNWIYTYFHILNFIYSLSAFVVLLTIGRWLAGTPLARPVQWIGASTYCVYLLHMQIVQSVARKLPQSDLSQLLAPVIGMAVMLLLIEIGKRITRKLPFGDKIRMLVGLR